MPFYHLRTRSEYSLLTSACKLADLENFIKESDAKAMCLMDDMSLSAGLRWSMHLQDLKVQPLIGLNVFIGKEIYDLNNLYPQLGLIAKSEKGYLNMLKILQCGHFEHEENDFQQLWVKMDELKQYSEDVILLTGGYRGVIGYEFLNFGAKMATETLDELHKTFGDRMYIELTRHGRTKEKELEDFLIDYAYKNNIPLVATNDVCFVKREHFKAFDALACIRDKVFLTDPTRKRLNEEYYLKSAKEMEDLFSDIPEAIENTEQIVRRCSFLIHKRKPTLPHFCDSPEKEAEMMEKMAYEGMEVRFKQIDWNKAIHKKEDYLERLKYEIGVIEKMGFPGYFLIVADFVQWSKHNGVAVGAGRGSGAGSLVAWCLKITEVDPLEYGLFFERFLNPERVSMPDFDIDFCQENRWKTIEYVMNKYGKDSVSRIITYGKMKAKMVLKDVGRVMQMSFNDTNEIVKLIPFNPLEPITLEKALEMIPKLREAQENDPKMAKMMDIAMCLEDLNRNTSMHAAGVVIGDKPLIEIGPVCSEEDEEIEVGDDTELEGDENSVAQIKSINHAIEELDENGNVIKKSHHKTTEQKITGNSSIDWFNAKPEHRIAVFGYDMKDCEKIGLVKFDFLGLQTLTVLSKACEMIKQNTGKEINIDTLPVDDKKTFDLLAKGHLKGIFQLETPLPRNALKRIKTDKILDIAAITSLNRPGPMENMPSFIRRKMGQEKCDYYHPILEPILKETYGIIIYQEQVMEVARKIAGYSLGEADLLRRAMGKKIKEEMDKQKGIFCERAEKLGLVSKDEAVKLFDVIEKFAGYGFNKAHAVSYTIISYQTAYLKAHYPVEFMVALMNLDINKTDKLNGFVNEATNMGIEIIPPDVNESTATFSCRDGKIVYALGAIKGMGVVFAEDICRIREEGGKFKDLQDFFTRCGRGLKNKNLFSKKTIESLCKSGAWKALGFNRRTILENIQSLVEITQEWAKRDRENNTARVMNMFGEDDSIPQIPRLRQYPEYNDEQLSALEFEIFGFYMNTHPLDPYRDKIEAFKFEVGQDALETTYKNETRLLMCGVITEVRMRFKNRKKFAFVHLLDFGGLYETSLFNDDLINQKADILAEGHKVVIEASATTSAETGTRLQIKDIYDLDDFFAQHKTREDVKLGANRKYKSANTGSGVNNFATTGETDVNTNATFIHQSNNNIIRHNEVKAFAVASPAFIPTTPKRQVASNTFTGVASGTITPNNAIYLDVDNPILELSQIKERVSNGEFKNYDNLVIKYHDNEFVLTIKDIKA
ncbi:MAG: DNA polymerase III subunit alpha [Rickettsiales bacterium]|nr:DNA polymerase III subunit alpha [Rickettsiales bacterium]